MAIRYLKEGQIIRIKLPDQSVGNSPRDTIEVQVGKIYQNSFLAKASSSQNPLFNLASGSKLNLLMGDNGSLFSGQCKLLDVENETYPLLELSLPEKIRRMEMRNWVRVPADLLVRYRMANYQWPFYEANTINVSGGGLLFMTKHVVDEQLELELGIRLPGDHLIAGIASVIRCAQHSTMWGDRYHIGCRFNDIHEKAREALIGFIFQKQRSLIKMENL